MKTEIIMRQTQALLHRAATTFTCCAPRLNSALSAITVNVFYQYERDDSSDSTRRFADNQVGVQGTWKL
jgi:hypothetical protein